MFYDLLWNRRIFGDVVLVFLSWLGGTPPVWCELLGFSSFLDLWLLRLVGTRFNLLALLVCSVRQIHAKISLNHRLE